MSRKIKKWIDLSGLPKRGKTSQINWVKSEKYFVNFKYGDIEGILKIKKYDSKAKILTVTYNDGREFDINKDNFSNCAIGKILNKYGRILEVSTNFKDSNRDITITDVIIKKDKNGENNRYYKYICNRCNFDCGQHYKKGILVNDMCVTKSSLVNGGGCSCCRGIAVSTSINSIYSTDKWMIPIGVDEESSKLYSKSSGENIKVKCPDCGIENYKTIYQINDSKSISCSCGDSISIPEKIVTSVLFQIKVGFSRQISKVDFKWCDRYRYDFYINKGIIIETHGEQHYKESSRGRSLAEEQRNDKLKRQLAVDNYISEYIIIDCRKSELEFIKNNILNSRLAKLYDLSNIDWNKAGQYAMSNLSKMACDLYNKSNGKLGCSEIGDIIMVNRNTICTYLKYWANLGLCNYDTSKVKCREIIVFKDGVIIDTFKSIKILCEEISNRFGVIIARNKIYDVIKGRRKTHKGFAFKYADEKVGDIIG